MCLAVPGTVTALQEGWAQVDYGGVCKQARTDLFASVAVGDRVLVHAGFVIQILQQQQAQELDELLHQAMAYAGSSDAYDENS